MRLIADTGLLVAHLNRDDRHHAWVTQLLEIAELPLMTCEAVFTESAFHLRDASKLLELLDADILQFGLDCKAECAALRMLARRFRDRAPDFADLCVIRLSELFPAHKVATVDLRDFTVYRRNGNQVIPIIAP